MVNDHFNQVDERASQILPKHGSFGRKLTEVGRYRS
jgi:hypothetical protein